MGTDQQGLDDAYDNDVYSSQRKECPGAPVINPEIATAIIANPMRVAYEQSEIENIDIYKAKHPNAPYEVGKTIGNPYVVLGRTAMDMIGLINFEGGPPITGLPR